ncbi:MAG: Gfo/Idh/MocA family oxidoreductase [Caldilineaceae bacterium]|nr:Gfo/Idh/MocA family oxidoreductase [Caldilineaceae bacterium]
MTAKSDAKGNRPATKTLRVGIIGCGRPRSSEGATGYGMAHSHAKGYAASPYAELAALADISPENAQAFQKEHGAETIYVDYRRMLDEADLDIVSICVWPHLHAEMVLAAAEAGVQAIHCEKPIAPTFGEVRHMVEVCARKGVQLTFNHQRRFAPPFRTVRGLLREGAIGELQRIEGRCPDMNDWGTHWFDMMHFYNDETPAEWVLGQIDATEVLTIFGLAHETLGISQVRFVNGVDGLLFAGIGESNMPANRLLGSDGVIEVGLRHGDAIRLCSSQTNGWQTIDPGGSIHVLEAVEWGIADLINALRHGTEPELSSRRAFRAAELTFATYESSRRRGRVELPLEIEDSPLLAMLESAPPQRTTSEV